MSRNSLYHIFIFFLILNNFSFIFAAYPKNYTFPLLYTVRIGSQSTEIKLLLIFNINMKLYEYNIIK